MASMTRLEVMLRSTQKKTQHVCPFERIREAKVLAAMNEAVEMVGVTNAAKHSHHEAVHKAVGMDERPYFEEGLRQQVRLNISR